MYELAYIMGPPWLQRWTLLLSGQVIWPARAETYTIGCQARSSMRESTMQTQSNQYAVMKHVDSHNQYVLNVRFKYKCV